MVAIDVLVIVVALRAKKSRADRFAYSDSLKVAQVALFFKAVSAVRQR